MSTPPNTGYIMLSSRTFKLSTQIITTFPQTYYHKSLNYWEYVGVSLSDMGPIDLDDEHRKQISLEPYNNVVYSVQKNDGRMGFVWTEGRRKSRGKKEKQRSYREREIRASIFQIRPPAAMEDDEEVEENVFNGAITAINLRFEV
ncbi:hypothetical protein SDJN03_06294, partial [Cucurbita argyrosperma subsp. sororia]